MKVDFTICKRIGCRWIHVIDDNHGIWETVCGLKTIVGDETRCSYALEYAVLGQEKKEVNGNTM